ncbi:hypothetical protein PMAYCL1PPCAC_30124 [Pristionchus mayeri]|uniref:Uncharacterized protein n=1 Tax=Pristionchus mayeri TaxID=1317129 RepID=A0AAN5DBB6_9BILA|nr:hypothetical protein PMAYCL1PPCAC_30124 [Pristionchus mayeri]
MVFGFLRRIFKVKKTYIVNDDEEKEPAESILFEKEEPSTAQLVKASRLSPLMWKYIFPSSPSHPVDFEEEEERLMSRRSCTTRTSTTSSAGYCSQTGSFDDDGIPCLGATSMGGHSVTEIELFSSKESSQLQEEDDISPVPINRTLPPCTPYRTSLVCLEVRKHSRNFVSSPHLNRMEKTTEELSSAGMKRCVSIWEEPTYSPDAHHYLFTPATLPPKTPYRASFARLEYRIPKQNGKQAISIPPPLVENDSIECDVSPSEESRATRGSSGGIWGEPDYSPASNTQIDSPSPVEHCSPYHESFARHESRKISLRRMPTATVSGRVKRMVKFFENDSERVEVPRRLDHAPPEFMRSCPQVNCTPTPVRTSHDHRTHSDLIRGITNVRCTRCNSHYRTPNSRRSMA